MKNRGFSRRVAIAGAGLLSLAMMSGVAWAQSETIRIGVGSDPVFAAFYLADQEGLFKAEGVDVDIQLYADGSEALNALVAGQVDAGIGAEPTTMLRIPRAELRPLAVAIEAGKNIKLVLAKGIADPAAIRKLGIVPGSASEYTARLALAFLKLDPAKVEFVPSGPPELPALLARGDIDAFFAWEPWPARGVEQGGTIALTSGDVGYTDTLWLTASAALLEKNPDGARKVLAALAKASDIAREDPDRAAAAVKKATSIPEATSLKMFETVTLKVRDFTDADYKSFDSIAQFLADVGGTQGLVPFRDVLQRGFYKEN